MFAGFSGVALTLTTRCNLSCSYCPQRRTEGQQMPDEIVAAAARLVAGSGHPHPRLTLTGGEPLLEPRLVGLAASTLSASARPGRSGALRLFTNGTLLGDELARSLAGADAEVTVSFDGVGDAQDHRGAGTGTLLAARLLRIAANEPGWYGRRVGARVTLHSGNVAALRASVALLVALGLRRIEVLPVVTPDVAWDEHSTAELDGQLEDLASASELDGEPEATPFYPYRPTSSRGDGSGLACGLGSPEALFLDVDGAVVPCGAMVPSVLPGAPPLVRAALDALGGAHVSDRDLRPRLATRHQSAGTLEFASARRQKRSRSGPCASCEAFPECFVCPASIAFAPEQDPGLVPAIQCDWNRLVAKHRRAFLARAAAREADGQRAGSSSSAPATSAVTPARIDGA